MSDPLSQILTLLDIDSGLSSRFEAGGPWAMHFAPYPHIKFGAALKGGFFLHIDGEEAPHPLAEGDCYLMSSGSAYRTGSDRDCPAIDGNAWYALHGGADGIARWGGPADTVIVGGRFIVDPEHGALLRDLLPPLIHIRAGSASATALRAVLELLAHETASIRPGLDLMTESLARIALLQVLRAFAGRADNAGAGWLGALGDQRIGTALRLLHDDPSHGWTLEQLAAASGMSRSGFALRFKTLVGQAPLDYLLAWRMRLARRALSDGGQTVSALAFELGYGSESAFSNAFKRVTGLAPKHYRDARRSAA